MFFKTNLIKLTLNIQDICTFYASNKMVVQVYVFFSFLLFAFGGGWVVQRKSEHWILKIRTQKWTVPNIESKDIHPVSVSSNTFSLE